MKLKIHYLLTLALLLSFLFSPFKAKAATIMAASCSQSDVQNAVNLASEGDTVQVPAGTCIWTIPVIMGDKWDNSYQRKSLTLKGAGIGQTIIKNELTAPFGVSQIRSGISVYLPAGKFVRITGFTFDGNNSLQSNGPILASGELGGKIRVDHSEFINLKYRGVTVFVLFGVIDHNVFTKIPGTTVTAVAIHGDVKGGDFNQNFINDNDGDTYSWDRPLNLGSEDALYVENNTFNFDSPQNGAIDTYDGSRYVFRFNTVKSTWTGNHGYDSALRSGFSYTI